MARLRFVTARDLFETFPAAESDVGAEARDEPALDFLRGLVDKEKWESAVSYCAYLLPRREAVWWGAQSLRRIQPHRAPKETTALDLAEAWVREPEEHNRRRTLDYGTEGDHRAPATWIALAAGWSGGSIAPPEFGHAPPPPDQTARAIRAGLLIAMARMPNDKIGEALRPCLEEGMKLAAGE